MSLSISRQIARFAHHLKYEDLPDEVIHEAKRYLYDSIGCAFGGYHTNDVNILRNVFRTMGGHPESTVIGFGDKIPAINATLVNSLMIRALDFNDIYWKEDPSHPSDLIPAALATGELMKSSFNNIIVAIVLAYEFEQRMCLFAVPGVRERKWHHATLTQFVSPIVAGKLMNLTEDQLVNAIGISGSHNHTIGCPTAGKLTMMKNTVDPMAVQSGVFAAILAKHGYSGTEEVFEGKEGLMDCFQGWDAKTQQRTPLKIYGRDGSPALPDWTWDIEALTGGLGDSYKIMDCSMKAFPTEALTHTHITATLKAVIDNNISMEDIEEVEVTTISRVCDILFDKHKYKPESRETADHSLPYCIARAILDKKITTQSFSDEKIHDPLLKEIIFKIKGIASIEFEKMFPEKQPSRVTIKTKNGGDHTVYLEYPKGDPREPMTMGDIENKFNALSGSLINQRKQDQIKQMIFECENWKIGEFMKSLAV